jgi:very-short-patch-repair endonuclease
MPPSLQHLLARQDGLITLGQAASCGTPHPRSADGFGAAPGGGSVPVSGPAAAFRHELLPRAPETVEVTVRRRSGPTAPSGIRVRRRDLDRRDLVGIHGIWVTDVPLTVLEAAAALDDGVNAKRAPAVRRLLVAAADRADPAAERILIKLLRDGGLDGWARGIRFGPYEIDLGFPEAKVAIEVDGWAWRVDADRFRTDRRKQNTLVVAAGWTVPRFTWHDLQKRPTQVVAEIRAALTRAA